MQLAICGGRCKAWPGRGCSLQSALALQLRLPWTFVTVTQQQTKQAGDLRKVSGHTSFPSPWPRSEPLGLQASVTCAGLGAHHDGVGGGASREVAHAAQEVPITHACGCEEDLLARAQVVCVQDLHSPSAPVRTMPEQQQASRKSGAAAT